MVYRFMYQGYSDGPVALRENSGAEHASMAGEGWACILYYEAQVEDLQPETVAEGALKPYPDGPLLAENDGNIPLFQAALPRALAAENPGKDPGVPDKLCPAGYGGKLHLLSLPVPGGNAGRRR